MSMHGETNTSTAANGVIGSDTFDSLFGGGDWANDPFLGCADLEGGFGQTLSPSNDSNKSLSPSDMGGLRATSSSMNQTGAGGNAHLGMKRSEPGAKVRQGGPGRIPRKVSKPQNMFQVWQQTPPPAPQMPQMQAAPIYAGGVSPYMDFNQMSPVMGTPENYAWMQARGARRAPFSPPMAMYGQPAFGMMPSPPFGYQFQQPLPMKLPVQALQRPSQTPRQGPDGHSQVMAPLILPVDLGNMTNEQLDPTAIPTAITSFLGSNGSLRPNEVQKQTFEIYLKDFKQLDMDNVTVMELKKLLRKFHLAATGKKEDLIVMVEHVRSFCESVTKDGSGKDGGSKDSDSSSATDNNADGNGEDKEGARSIANGTSANAQVDRSFDAFLA